MEIKTTIITIVCGVFGSILLYAFFASIKDFYKTFLAIRWPKTSGLVLVSEIEIDNSDYEMNYIPKVEYKYSVNNLKYHSDTAYMGTLSQSKYHAKYLTDKFKLGQVVLVAYNPKNHSDSTLIFGFNRLNISALISMIVFGIIGAILMMASLVQGDI